MRQGLSQRACDICRIWLHALSTNTWSNRGVILIFHRLPHASFIREDNLDTSKERFVDICLQKHTGSARMIQSISGSVQFQGRADTGGKREYGFLSEKERR